MVLGKQLFQLLGSRVAHQELREGGDLGKVLSELYGFGLEFLSIFVGLGLRRLLPQMLEPRLGKLPMFTRRRDLGTCALLPLALNLAEDVQRLHGRLLALARSCNPRDVEVERLAVRLADLDFHPTRCCRPDGAKCRHRGEIDGHFMDAGYPLDVLPDGAWQCVSREWRYTDCVERDRRFPRRYPSRRIRR